MSELYISITDLSGVTRTSYIKRRETLTKPPVYRPKRLFFRLSGSHTVVAWSSVYGVVSNPVYVEKSHTFVLTKRKTQHPFGVILVLI